MVNQTRTISVTSGKGGVGKTTMVCNLAHYLGSQGRKVLIFDGDMGMSNVELMMHVKPRGDISDVLEGRKTINEIITPVNSNVSLISGGSAVDFLQNLDSFERKVVLDCFGDIEQSFDDMIIDTSPGLNDNVLYLNAAAQENLVVLTPEPTSMSDAYAIIKTMNKRFKSHRFTVLCNQVRSEQEGQNVFMRFSEVVSKFLTVGLGYAGCVVLDRHIRHSVSKQRLILEQFPDAPAAIGMRRTFANLKQNEVLREQSGGLELFWNQLVGVA